MPETPGCQGCQGARDTGDTNEVRIPRVPGRKRKTNIRKEILRDELPEAAYDYFRTLRISHR
eukprot:2379897-Pyramimonas_sp.AAC.1